MKQGMTIRDKLIQSGVLYGTDPRPAITDKHNADQAKRILSKVNAILARRALTKH